MQYKEESVHYNLKKYLTSIKNSKEKLENIEFSIQKLTKAVILSAWYLENQQWSQTEYKYLNIDFFNLFLLPCPGSHNLHLVYFTGLLPGWSPWNSHYLNSFIQQRCVNFFSFFSRQGFSAYLWLSWNSFCVLGRRWTHSNPPASAQSPSTGIRGEHHCLANNNTQIKPLMVMHAFNQREEDLYEFTASLIYIASSRTSTHLGYLYHFPIPQPNMPLTLFILLIILNIFNV